MKYIKTRTTHEDLLYSYYGNETTSDKPSFYQHLGDNFTITEKGDIYWNHLFIARDRGAYPQNINDQENGLCKLQTFIDHLELMLSQNHIKKRLSQQTLTRLWSFTAHTVAWCLNTQNHTAIEQKCMEAEKLVKLELQSLNLLPFRKLRFARKIYMKQNDQQLVKRLQAEFGSDAVLIIGDWSAPNMKFHEPIRNKVLIRVLNKAGFQVYLIDEHKISKTCPDCEKDLTTFAIRPNPRPYMRKKHPNVKCHGLLKCGNHSPSKVYNRDMAAVRNFQKILFELRRTGCRPACFQRRSKESEEKPGFKRKQEENTTSTKNKKPRSSA